MPITGLTDRAASFPQIGLLRKGAPKPEKGPGRDLKYFRFDSDDQAAVAAFEQAYGPEPTSVHVFLPFATVAENFEAWQEHWSAGALQHRCDGRTCAIWLNGQRYSTEPRPCPHLNAPPEEKNRCKPAGRLKVIIPELRRLAYVTVLTSSIHDIITLQQNLEALEVLRGTLRGIPLILSRRPREISMPGPSGKRIRSTKWLLAIEAAPSWVDLQLAAMERQALPSGGQMLALSPAGMVDTTTGEIVDDDSEVESIAVQAVEPEAGPVAPQEIEIISTISAKEFKIAGDVPWLKLKLASGQIALVRGAEAETYKEIAVGASIKLRGVQAHHKTLGSYIDVRELRPVVQRMDEVPLPEILPAAA